MQGNQASLHHAALTWLLLSPPLVAVPPGSTALLAQFSDPERSDITHWLATLQADSAPLADWMAARAEVRIGRYAERLMEFYLTHGPQHQLVAAHVPLRSEMPGIKNPVIVTQGELDFLLTNRAGQHLHWELAVKFFLCTATGDVASPEDFIGPNGVETLAHKWHKLFARQLTHTPPVPWDTTHWQPQAYVRGWMFYRWGFKVPQCAALYPQHGKAWWTTLDAMGQLPQAQYAYLPRLHWMAPIESALQLQEPVVVLARDAMADYLKMQWTHSKRSADAQMVVQIADPAAQDVVGMEVQRFFIRP
jgi:uncharacterized protein